MKVIFFPNGNTAVFEHGQQVPDLQESWFMLYVGMLAAYGLDPTQIEFVMPDTSRAEVVETKKGGFNWITVTDDQVNARCVCPLCGQGHDPKLTGDSGEGKDKHHHEDGPGGGGYPLQ